MIVEMSEAIEKSRVEMDGAQGVWIRWLIGEDSGAPNFYLRLFEVEPGGHTPFHTHPFEHEVYILAGKGRINTADGARAIAGGTFAYVAPGEEHQFENTGADTLKFLCVIPREEKCV